jgi:hypothetical protein
MSSVVSARAAALADRLEQGANALIAFAGGLSASDWTKAVPKDGRPVGVVVHHVASVYPVEIQLAQAMAGANPVKDVTWDVINKMNAGHAADNANVSKEAAIDLLRRNSAAAADAIRALTDQQLDQAVTVSLYEDAPLTCQFMLEDHAVRHSYHHLFLLKKAVGA